MTLSSLRRTAQIAVALVAVLAASGAALRYFTRGSTFSGDLVWVSPRAGPGGLRPSFASGGDDGGREVTVHPCASTCGGVEDCASSGKGKAGERLTAAPSPRELPDTTTVERG